ncbi:putative restriction endonuclease [Tunisvirus fontaine2]|uniref:Putative restriction endonuclease n=1 Tax=Tunisvirus fontaine2 TaxID=1421067 RepID=V9SE68_9VIRU|nr:putative restriction endonuclease [Tunisvirus fontaine2]AHC55035.1 putative restriction endonuclease [Tunisvirus fontaine2]
MCLSEKCGTCFKKSFANHEKSRFWNFEKNKKTPREVFMRSNKKYWFKCDKCKHSFETGLNKIFIGRFCPFCSSEKLCLSENCETCLEKSFATHEKVAFWNFEKNKKTPREVFRNSEKKRWFKCANGHDFFSILKNVSNGSWCPKCKNKTETKLLSFLEENFDGVIHQFKISWCKNPETDRFLPFDFCVSKTVIELDGRQHYEQVSNWRNPEEQQKTDRYKESCALTNGHSVLRILQEDIWNDKINWKKLLLENIKDHEIPIVKHLWDKSLTR